MAENTLTIVKRLTTAFLSLAFIGAGILHFMLTRTYASIIPDLFPFKEQLVYFTGLWEVMAGIGLGIPKLKQKSAYSLCILLVLVFPANLNMAFTGEDLGLPHELLWWRLPLQPVLIALVYWCAK